MLFINRERELAFLKEQWDRDEAGCLVLWGRRRVGKTELHSTSKTQFKGGGPGLGLAITKGIIEAHGGRVWAESPGYDVERCPGSDFRIMLPIYLEPPEQPSKRLLGLEVES